MTVNDVRHVTFEGPVELKRMYDYAHSVFPIHKWSHDLGPFSIEGSGDRATATWRWIVNWRSEVQGVVSTGIYHDVWEKRDGVWKCVERTSDIDQNWPLQAFQPYVDRQDGTLPRVVKQSSSDFAQVTAQPGCEFYGPG